MRPSCRRHPHRRTAPATPHPRAGHHAGSIHDSTGWFPLTLGSRRSSTTTAGQRDRSGSGTVGTCCSRTWSRIGSTDGRRAKAKASLSIRAAMPARQRSRGLSRGRTVSRWIPRAGWSSRSTATAASAGASRTVAPSRSSSATRAGGSTARTTWCSARMGISTSPIRRSGCPGAFDDPAKELAFQGVYRLAPTAC